jgi:hypothetical protein
MSLALDSHALRIVNVQVDPKGGGILARRPVGLGSLQIGAVNVLVHESVDTDSVKA